MSSPQSPVCASCGAVASKQCDDCKTAMYCGTTCQKLDWSAHKTSCRKDDLALVVKRAGQLLQDIFYVYREKTFDRDVFKVEDTGDRLVIETGCTDIGVIKQFPHHLIRSEEHKRILLSVLYGNEPIAYLHDIFLKMLHGLDVKVVELAVNLKSIAEVVYIVDKVNNVKKNNRGTSHNVMGVGIPDGKSGWICDPSGAKFGLWDVVTQVTDHVKNRAQRKVVVMPRGTAKAASEKAATLDDDSGHQARAVWKIVNVLNDIISDWETETKLSLPALLRQPGVMFAKIRASFIEFVEHKLDRFAQEQTSKRALQSEAQSKKVTVDNGSSQKSKGAYRDFDDPGFNGFDTDDDDDDDEYEGDFEEPLVDRTAEVRSCGRFRR